MKQLREDIEYWLFDYLEPEDRVGVNAMIFRIAWNYAKRSFVKGLLLGTVVTLITLWWIS